MGIDQQYDMVFVNYLLSAVDGVLMGVLMNYLLLWYNELFAISSRWGIDELFAISSRWGIELISTVDGALTQN